MYLMSILKLFFDTFDSFLKKGVITCIISLLNENIVVFRCIDNSSKEKNMEKSESVKAVQ